MISLLLLTKVTIVLALGGAAYFCSARLSAGTRHALCAITLGTSVLVPFTAFFGPVRMPDAFFFAATSVDSAAPARLPGAQYVDLVLLAGGVVVLVRFVIGLIYLGFMTRRSIVSGETAPGVEIRLAVVQTPLMWGWVRPVVLLPLEARDWPAERRRFAIAHELAHVERRDNWSMLLAVAAQTLYWFHPLVWLLTAKMAEQRELACDNRVLSSGANPSEYADFLVDLSRRYSSPALFGCAMASYSHSLRGRIMNILHAPSHGRSSRWSTPTIVLLSGLLAATAIVFPAKAGRVQSAERQKQVYRIGDGVTAPRVLHKVEPRYTEEARDAKIVGAVVLSITIDASGHPGDIHVVRGLDAGLDQNAIDAVSQWRFAPATKDEQPVAVQATVEVNFRLK